MEDLLTLEYVKVGRAIYICLPPWLYGWNTKFCKFSNIQFDSDSIEISIAPKLYIVWGFFAIFHIAKLEACVLSGNDLQFFSPPSRYQKERNALILIVFIVIYNMRWSFYFISCNCLKLPNYPGVRDSRCHLFPIDFWYPFYHLLCFCIYYDILMIYSMLSLTYFHVSATLF